jgi:hypothetical protein
MYQFIVGGDILRFFIYWKQKKQRTDFDLSCMLYDEDFQLIEQVSYTNLQGLGMVHSGDLTEAPKGASEFIDVDLSVLPKNIEYIIPVVYKYAGESFEEVDECFFGYMKRTKEQIGKPFEPLTVETKSEIRGDKGAAYPLVFYRDEEDFRGKWLSIIMNGRNLGNRTEENYKAAIHVVSNIVEKEFLKMETLLNRYVDNSEEAEDKPSTYIAMTREDLSEIPIKEGDKVYTLENIHELIPK